MASGDLVIFALTVFAAIYGVSDALPVACTDFEVQSCLAPMGALATEKDASKICPVMEKGRDCLDTLLPLCTNAVGAESSLALVQNSLRDVNAMIASACVGDCTYPKLHDCFVPVVALAQVQDLGEICPTILRGRDCLVDMQPHCTYNDLRNTVEEQIAELNNEHSKVCQGECSWPNVKECTNVFDELNTEKNMSKICPKSMGGKECLENMKPLCTPSTDILDYINGYLFEVYKGINSGCTGECSWPNLYQCAKPLEHFDMSTPLSESCPPMKLATECMKEMRPKCTDETIKGVLQGEVNRLDGYLPYCPADNDGSHMTTTPTPEYHECSAITLQKCLEDVSSLNATTPNQENCPHYKSTKECLKEIEPWCTDAQIKSTITSTMVGIETVLSLCPADGPVTFGCDLRSWKLCSDPLSPMADISFENFDAGKICPLVHDGLECMQKLVSLCEGTETNYETIKNATDGAMTGLNAMKPFCPKEHATHSPTHWPTGRTHHPTTAAPFETCDWITLSQCTGPLAPMAQMTDVNKMDFNEICPLVHNGIDCLMRLKPLCTDQTIKETIKSAMTGLDILKPFCGQGGTWPTQTPTHHPTHSPTGGTHYPVHWQTHYPTAAPFDRCDWTTFQTCSGPLAGIAATLNSGNYDKEKLCSLVSWGKDCFWRLKPLCTDKGITDAIEGGMNGLNNMRYICAQEKTTHKATWPTTGDPYRTTDWNTKPCDWSSYYDCTDPLDSMHGEEMQRCQTWWRSQRCMKELDGRCHHGDVQNKLRETWENWNHAMHSCEEMCDGYMIHDCLRQTKEENSMEHKCRESGRAKQCLHDLSNRCQYHEVWDWIKHNDMPWLEDHMNTCMIYGHETGSGSDIGDYDKVKGANDASYHLPSTLAFFISVTLAFVASSIRL